MKPYDAQDDEALTQIAGQSPEAFAVLYQRYLPKVYGYVFQRVWDRADAEEITANVFTNALDGLMGRKYRPGHCFAAWLFAIARRRLVDFYNRRQDTQLEEHVPSLAPGPEWLAEMGADRDRLTKLLAQLEDEKVELLRLRYAAGLSYAEIAALNGKSEAAQKMEIRRILEWLRAHWEIKHA